jgi:hypothetical protein
VNSAATFRTTSEINVKARVKALVFGEDNRIINPGDLLLEMVSSEQGDRLGANQTRFEIYISGRDIEQLLCQVERAAYLRRQNDWLNEPSSRILTPEEVADRKAIPIVPKPKPVYSATMAAEIRERDKDLPIPKLG